MGKIVRLDDRLSNKIAAGEVVERPASVVKELAENAVDAESTRVDIEVEEGGLTRIKVIDNGEGIPKDDVELAFDRHATSKIKNERDLFNIQTLGFRGEALPSIASVSHLEIKTSTGEDAGTHLIIEGGKILERHSSASRKGTEIVVTRLFYNTPARLKHLKTVHTELGNITDAVYRMALAYPSVSFSLLHNGKKTFQTNGSGDTRQVIASIYGVNTAKKTVPIYEQSIDFTVFGFIAKPELTRASRQHMAIFMNGRYIRSYPITRAILEGYHTLLPIRRYPISVICIDMDPTLIDVNVHPSKLEARLSKEKELCQLVEKAIKDALRKLQLIPETVLPKRKHADVEQQRFSLEHASSDNQAKGTETRNIQYPAGQARSAQKQNLFDVNLSTPLSEPIVRESEPVTDYPDGRREDDFKVIKNQDDTDGISAEEKSVDENHGTRVPTLYPIGQMHGTYILAQNDKGLYLIDQHAAQERIKYEFFRDKVGHVTQEVQELLVPLTFEFSSAETAIIEENLNRLKEVGVFLESFGQGTYLVRSHPQWFPEGFEKDTIEDIIDQVIADKKADIAKLREDAAILMSCKRSIKANQHLRNDEIFSLLESLRKTVDPFTCPHGRPIIVHFTTYEMEKMFKRVM
ncbi:MAG TPA: DNA mismatch repair endonuclease MutL [Bacillales bacterium]|nr:DNA mismatch repair endonuclease MutL [Bacillales bacterium]